MTHPLFFPNVPGWESPRKFRPEHGGRSEPGRKEPPGMPREPRCYDATRRPRTVGGVAQLPTVRRIPSRSEPRPCSYYSSRC
jgi:hypothetical protein